MGWSYNQLIAEMHDRHDAAQLQLSLARSDITTARTRWNLADYPGAIDALIDAVYHNNQAGEDVLAGSFYGYNGSSNIIPTALDLGMACKFITEAPPYELTWQAIVEAWTKDDFAGRAYTIATIDRMRQILWDEPFDVRWAARPEVG